MLAQAVECERVWCRGMLFEYAGVRMTSKCNGPGWLMGDPVLFSVRRLCRNNIYRANAVDDLDSLTHPHMKTRLYG
jgi:hypothetical protein